MTMRKYGTGEVTETEKSTEIAKQAAKEAFTAEDEKALADENEKADG